MPLIAQFAADAASFSVRGSDGSAVSFEVPWHRAVLTIEDEAGNVTRSAEVFVDGRFDVRGEGETPHEISWTGGSPAAALKAQGFKNLDELRADGQAKTADPAPADDMAGQGFAALQPAGGEPEAGHEDLVGTAEQGEVRP